LRYGFRLALRFFIVGHREGLAIGLTVDLDHSDLVDRRVLVFEGEGDRSGLLLGQVLGRTALGIEGENKILGIAHAWRELKLAKARRGC
jgi:hypothetical protein